MPHIVIVGAGLTGLATAFWLRRRAPYVRVTLLEARERAGGNVGTEQIHGFRIERGPNGFLARSPALPRLIEALGLSERLLPASSGSRRHRFLYLHGQLHRVPSHPVGLLLSTLLSGEGKKELLVGLCRQIRFSPANRDQDESVYDFVARRFGREVADVFADALVTGIQGGDPKLLSMAACFPRLVDWERRYGSVIRGMIQYVRQQRRQAQQAPGSLSRSQLYSFREGLQVLVDTLVQAVGASLNLAAPVTALRYQPATAVWQVYSPTAPPLQADAVVLSCPAYVQAELLAPLDAALAVEVAAIPYNRIVVAALGYRQVDCAQVPEGFGYIAPQSQGRDVLGVQWCSSIYPERAPAGMVLWRALCGGMRRPDLLDLDDTTLLNRVQREMTTVLKIQGPPVFHHIIRWPRAIPQYVVGHLARLRRINAALTRWPRLFLSGNAYRGIALSDCAEEAERLADQLVSLFPSASHDTTAGRLNSSAKES